MDVSRMTVKSTNLATKINWDTMINVLQSDRLNMVPNTIHGFETQS